MIDVSIIIVNWNVADLLAACLDSILSSAVSLDETSDDVPVIEIIVVDSASTDNSVPMLREQYPMVRLFAEDENVGFVRGNNIGFMAAQGRYHFLLNPDTEVQQNTIKKMIEYLDSNPTIAIAGPHTLNTDGTHQSTRRRFPTVPLAFFESTWAESLTPQHIRNQFKVLDLPNDGTYEVDWVQGSAILARRDVYETIGGLDTNFVMFFEETDWCKRAKDAGFLVAYIGDAVITHHGGQSSGQVVAQKHQYYQESKLRYYHKHFNRLIAEILRVYLLAHYLFQLILESAKALLGSKRDMRHERIKVYSQILRRGLKVS